MREFAANFYSSKAWQHCREAYKKYKGGLCEKCYAKGIVKAGEIVHHKIHLNPENINDPSVTMNFENLELVCRDHHAELHSNKCRRYRIDENGRVECL